jgi:hypothetical protein
MLLEDPFEFHGAMRRGMFRERTFARGSGDPAQFRVATLQGSDRFRRGVSDEDLLARFEEPAQS